MLCDYLFYYIPYLGEGTSNLSQFLQEKNSTLLFARNGPILKRACTTLLATKLIIFAIQKKCCLWLVEFILIKIFGKQKDKSTLNTQYVTNPTIVCPVKMEYGWNFSISGLKMMVKSSLRKMFLKFLHALAIFY